MVRHQGQAVVVAIVGWGVAVTAFGAVVAAAPGVGTLAPGSPASWALWPATGCMVLAGAADTVSSIFRSTILQAATPDAMRGRLQGIFIVVVAGGPRLGDLLIGAVGSWRGEAFAAIAGGVTCAVGVLTFIALQPGFRHYDAEHPTP
jgi:ENTS family enterobactin (siderophore) exporter